MECKKVAALVLAGAMAVTTMAGIRAKIFPLSFRKQQVVELIPQQEVLCSI